MSAFDKVPEAPPDAIFGLNVAFKNDPDPSKINLVVGAYRTEEGQPLVLSSVKKAEELMLGNPAYNKEYLPIDGSAEFIKVASNLLFSPDLIASHGKKIVSIQTLSGTGAVRTGADFIKRFMPNATVYISDPTWPNHKNIFTAAGVPWKAYRYYNVKTNSLDIAGMIADLEAAPNGSVVLLHACAHNPTGMDPTAEQWNTIMDLLRRKGHFTFMDCAYQGFASGDLERDATPVRHFVRSGMELFVAQSFAKNFGLYGERIGALHVVCGQDSVTKAVSSQLKQIARANYSNPPMHGAHIVSIVLSNQEMYNSWKVELKAMADRIQLMRELLYEDLKGRGVHWPHIMAQIGMFAFTGMTAGQVEFLQKKYHIYLTSDGRISLPGLNRKTVPIVAAAIQDAVSTVMSNL